MSLEMLGFLEEHVWNDHLGSGVDGKYFAEHCPQMVPYFAIGLFAGIRPEEINRLRWEQIENDRDHLEVLAGNAKKRVRRLVDISDNLKKWLTAYAQVAGKVTPPNSRRLGDRAKKAAGLDWSVDVMRHSFISYHVAIGRNIAATAHQAGNSEEVIRSNYLDYVTRNSAEEFWGIEPSLTRRNKVIQIA